MKRKRRTAEELLRAIRQRLTSLSCDANGWKASIAWHDSPTGATMSVVARSPRAALNRLLDRLEGRRG